MHLLFSVTKNKTRNLILNFLVFILRGAMFKGGREKRFYASSKMQFFHLFHTILLSSLNFFFFVCVYILGFGLLIEMT